MPTQLTLYQDSKEITDAVLNGRLELTIDIKIKHGDWDTNSSDPNTQVDFSANSLQKTLNSIMTEKNIPIKFRILIK